MNHCEIARKSIEYWLNSRVKYLPNHHFGFKAGCFVTLFDAAGLLRGCIGTIEPRHADLALEIADNARSSATRDHRFSTVESEELPGLTLEVSVLAPAEEIQSQSELNPKIYGVIVEHSGRRGVLLPDIEGVTTIDQQIAIAKRKAFISTLESVKIWRFKVEKHKE
jgi:AmmeMemoRadiSam system protein A